MSGDIGTIGSGAGRALSLDVAAAGVVTIVSAGLNAVTFFVGLGLLVEMRVF